MKRHFIFDIDDNLTNSYAINQQLFVDTFTKHDPAVDIEYLRDLHFHNRGASMKLQFKTAIEHFGWKMDADQLVAENEKMQIESVSKFDNMKVFSGVPEILAQLKAMGKIVSTCTNRQYGSQKKIFESNNITQYFDNIISCKDEGHEKPDPYCLLKLIDKYDLPKDDYIYFGDSKTDRDFAFNAGIDFIIIDHYLNERKFYELMIKMFE